MKIPFDIKFRPQIESGEYKVVTGDNRPVRIISWDKRVVGGRIEIVCLVPASQGDTDTVQLYYPDGTLISGWSEKFKLFIITPEPELTDFDKIWEEEDCDEIISLLQDTTPTLKEKLKELCHAWYDKGFDKAYHNQDEVVAFNAFEECAKQIKKKLDGYRLITFNQLRLIIDNLVEDARKKYLGGK